MYQRLTLLAFFVAGSSSQLCYYGAGSLADDYYVPCGDGDSNYSSCCVAGDFCLDGGACWSPATEMTYISGCTDSSYSDSSCGAQSCDKDTQFQGIAICDSNNWVCCGTEGQTGDFPTPDYSSDCPCDAGYSTAIVGASALSATLSLPTDLPTTYDVLSSTSTATSSSSADSTPLDSSVPATPTSSSANQSCGGDDDDCGSSQSTSSAASSSSSAATSSATAASSTTSNSEPSYIHDTVTVTQAPTNGVVIPSDLPAKVVSASSSSPPTGTPSPAGMPTKTKIGLGVGIPLAVAAIALFGVGMFCLRRRGSWGGKKSSDASVDRSTAIWQGDVSAAPIVTSEASAYQRNVHEKSSVGNQPHTPQQPPWTPSLDAHPTPPPTYYPSPQMAEARPPGITAGRH